jgi:hypothetical protein
MDGRNQKKEYSRDRCYDFLKKFSPKNSAKNWHFRLKTKLGKLCKILLITLVFEKNANFFRQILSKISENCDHNIDLRIDSERNKELALRRGIVVIASANRT